MHLPPKKRPGQPVLAKDWNLLIDALTARTPRPTHGMELVFTSSGFSYRVRRNGTNEATVPPPCPFGTLVPMEVGNNVVTAIRGGTVHCGNQNYVIADKQTPTNDGQWLAYVSAGCVVNQDDDGAILLPGVSSGTGASAIQYTGSSYPNNSHPSAGSPNGTIILPIGVVTVTDGSARFWPDGCGNFHVEHCSGTLSYYRS